MVQMQRYRFRTVAMHYPTHAYVKEIERDASVQPDPGRLRRIHRELTSLGSDLPVSWGSSIFVCADENRPDVLRALITGPVGTPYQDGCFVFDLYLPLTYPNDPPMVTFRSTANNLVRFNPNLYHSGKVCLSLLGTWAGDPWIPATSSIFQVQIGRKKPEEQRRDAGNECGAGTGDRLALTGTAHAHGPGSH